MVLRFASQKLLNLYFRCLILNLIKYIQRNKESKEICCVSFLKKLSAIVFVSSGNNLI